MAASLCSGRMSEIGFDSNSVNFLMAARSSRHSGDDPTSSHGGVLGAVLESLTSLVLGLATEGTCAMVCGGQLMV